MSRNVRRHLALRIFGGTLAIVMLSHFATACVGVGMYVGKDDVRLVKNGDSIKSVRNRFGAGLRHHFTVSRRGHEWVLCRCYLKGGPLDGRDRIDLLFCDGVFYKFVNISKTVKFRHCDADDKNQRNWQSPYASWAPNDFSYVDQILDSIFDANDFESMSKWPEIKEIHWGFLPVVIIFTPILILYTPQDVYATLVHRREIDRLSGFNLHLGDSKASVYAAFGHPDTMNTNKESGREVWTYVCTKMVNNSRVGILPPRLVVVFHDNAVEYICNDVVAWSDNDWLVHPSWWSPDGDTAGKVGCDDK